MSGRIQLSGLALHTITMFSQVFVLMPTISMPIRTAAEKSFGVADYGIQPESRLSRGEKLSDIRIVPNPYNIRDPLLVSYGLDEHNRKLWFYNLPGEVTIKLYTESGDLVKTIIHNPPNRVGSIDWDMLTDNQQAIASGLYIVVFEKPDGERAFQKFLVVK